jgi:hypothetical protein
MCYLGLDEKFFIFNRLISNCCSGCNLLLVAIVPERLLVGNNHHECQMSTHGSFAGTHCVPAYAADRPLSGGNFAMLKFRLRDLAEAHADRFTQNFLHTQDRPVILNVSNWHSTATQLSLLHGKKRS